MTPSKNIEIIHLFLTKLEQLNDDERAVLINSISLAATPSVHIDKISLTDYLNTQPSKVSRYE